MLNEWILAWIQHQLPRDPLHLFEANIFYPAHDTLAYSEPLIVPALLGAPVRWLGGSPVLVHNLLIIAGLALSAFAAYVVAFEWTADRRAALVAACAFAFNTHLLVRLAHLQALHAYGLPLALLATDRLLVQPRVKDALWLALWMTVMAYTSGHFLIFATVMIAVAILARPGDWVRRPLAVLPQFALAAAVAAVAIVPLYLPYRRVAIEQGLVRSLQTVSDYSATLNGYLAAAGRLHFYTWSEDLFRSEVEAFFPGVVVMLLTVIAVGMVWRARRYDREAASHDARRDSPQSASCCRSARTRRSMAGSTQSFRRSARSGQRRGSATSFFSRSRCSRQSASPACGRQGFLAVTPRS